MAEFCCTTDRLREKFRIKSPSARNALAEFFGTSLLLFIGLGVVMQFILSEEKMNTWIHINLGWGLALALCVYCCSKSSGGHFNPAVSLGMYTLGNLSLKDFGLYCVAQLLGTFVGSAGAYSLYYDQFTKFAGDVRTISGPLATAGCFCSFPADHVSNCTAFFDQVFGTMLLMLFICVIVDKRNEIPAAGRPLLIGFTLMTIGCSYGLNLGYPINPARDLGPRIFAFFIYGAEVFTMHGYYFWIPVVAPMLGAPLGAWLYYFFIGFHIPEERAKEYKDEAKQPLRAGEDA